jgi:hypothetical protein
MPQRRTKSINLPLQVFEAVCGLPPSEAKLLLYIIWQTWGQSSPRDISITQFERGLDGKPGTGLGRDTIMQGLKKLEARGLIHVEVKSEGYHTYCYSLGEPLLDRRRTA